MVIPPEDYDALEELLHLPKETTRPLLKTLQEQPPALHQKTLVDRISPKTNIGRPQLLRLMRVMFRLFLGYKGSDLSKDEYLKGFRQTLAETKLPRLTFDNAAWEDRKIFLSRILDCEDSIGVTAKALNVMVDHARVFKDGRVLTDFRPVFRSDPREPPAAAVIVHTLKIEYQEGEEEKDFFVALDSRDISRLEDLLKRAKLKEIGLKKSLQSGKITVLEL